MYHQSIFNQKYSNVKEQRLCRVETGVKTVE